MRPPLPVEIVGGGLAGLALGLALRRSGVPVTIFEAGVYPRHRVCGEFISGLTEKTSEALGIREFLDDAERHNGVVYYLRDKALHPFELPETALGISRFALDRRVADAFAASGGRLLTGTRADDRGPVPGRVHAAGRRRTGPFLVGLKVHVRGLELANDLEVHLGDGCYLGMSRVESGAVNLCGIFRPRPVADRGTALLHAYLERGQLGALSRRIRAALPDPATFCTSAVTLGDRRVGATDRIRIGDACATIPPFTGNGLAMALEGAELAVAPLRAYSRREAGWEDAGRAILLAQRARFGRRLMVAGLLHPFFLGRRLQRLLAAAVDANLVPFRAYFAALR